MTDSTMEVREYFDSSGHPVTAIRICGPDGWSDSWGILLKRNEFGDLVRWTYQLDEMGSSSGSILVRPGAPTEALGSGEWTRPASWEVVRDCWWVHVMRQVRGTTAAWKVCINEAESHTISFTTPVRKVAP